MKSGGLPFVSLKCVNRGGGFRIDGLKRFSGDYTQTNICQIGDIVVAVTDMTQERRIVAHAARVPRLGAEFGVMSMDLVKILPSGELPKGFLHGLLRFSEFSPSVSQHANGVNVLHLSPSQIEAFEFPCPPLGLASQYAEINDALFDTADVLEAKNANLRRTRDLLLPRLMSGAIAAPAVGSETLIEKEI